MGWATFTNYSCSYEENKKQMNTFIYTMVYGAYHVNLFKDAAFRSLNWPKNRKALQTFEWHILTRQEHFAELEQLFEGSPYKLVLIDMGKSIYVNAIGPVAINLCQDGLVLLHGLKHAIQYGLENSKKMFFAPPDTIFGDGSAHGILKAGEHPQTAVMVPHPRVLPSILEEIKYGAATEGAYDNPKLVGMFNRHAHLSWSQAEEGNDKNTTFESGVLWSRVTPTLTQVMHQLPTAYLVSFNNDDWNFWWGASSFGDYDHRWPGDNFIRQERQRYVGSSDAAFILEVTDHDKNVSKEPPAHMKGKMAPHTYFNWRHHNAINKQYISYFRSE